MLFTTQQRQGGQRYNPKVLIGNWREDVDLDQIRFKDFLKRREGGQLVVHQIQEKLQKSLTTVGHSFSGDGKLHFGDRIMLLNKKTNGFLVTDMGDKIEGDEGVAVTASPQYRSPVARSVFILQRFSEDDGFPGDYLHYGQQFTLTVHPYLSQYPLYLHSLVVSPMRFARFSRHQEVCMAPRKNANTIWVIEHSDPKVRFEMNGHPVGANQAVVIKHNLTGQWLAADNINYKNDYGSEFEVCSHSFLNHKKAQQLSSEKVGKLTVDIPSRHQGDENVWMFVTSNDPSAAQENLPAEGTSIGPEQLLSRIRQVLLERGGYGIRGLSKIFKNMDANGNRLLDPEDFKWGLINYGIILNDSEISTLVSCFDRNKDGIVNFDEFLTTIKGPMNNRRLRLVALAYEKLDKNGDGQVTLDDIARTYDASRHPDVVSGKKTDAEIFREFITMWDTEKPDGIVTLQEFARYYEDVSASIDNDDYFEAMLRQAWKL
ncbi:unnamed protein product [Blepharisma stoltei]|uniref:EF-hand domain-containing protein n=1 Tax=Blepharisma stoltei TaxID=1481888 RepID=A0AAU9I4M0_9CILI|nr:unnamed protein product [Blepharisma stoltei]